MNGKTKVYSEPVPLAQRLHELGVSRVVLRNAVQFGVGYASECTSHDPPVLAGILAWGKVVRSLRDQLIPKGWESDNGRNYATVVHPDHRYAIAAAGGDAYTGVMGRYPSTRSEKGPATRDAIAANQGAFADIDEATWRPLQAVQPRRTWLLLYFLDEEAGEIRMELSLPAGMTSEGYVTSWVERLILPPVVITAPLEPEHVEGEEIDVKVERRRSEANGPTL